MVYYSNIKPEYPARVILEIGEQQLLFVHTGDDRYAAELEGKRCPLRTVQQLSIVSEGGSLRSNEPMCSAGETANIDNILRCLALSTEHKPLPRGVELRADENWGHFRQNTFFMVSITIAEDGTVEINESIGYQDDSYY